MRSTTLRRDPCRHRADSGHEPVAPTFAGAGHGRYGRHHGRAATARRARRVREARLPDLPLVVPVLAELRDGRHRSRSTPRTTRLPRRPPPLDDTDLAVSWHHAIETVPTLMRVVDGARSGAPSAGPRPSGRAHRRRRARADLPAMRPGCGSLSVDPDRATSCARPLRRLDSCAPAASSSPTLEDELEACSSAAGPTACRSCRRPRRACCACSTGTTRARRGRRRRAAGPRRVHRREGRDQRGDGRAASPSTCPWCSPPSRRPAPTSSTSTACSRRRCRSGPVLVVNGPITRGDRHELGRQRARPGQPREPHDRPRAPARHPQRRRRPARRGRPGDARQPGQDRLLLRRGRGGLALGRRSRVESRLRRRHATR